MVQEAGVRLGAGWVLLAVCLGQFMIQLDLTAVNVALPDVARSLGSSTPVLQWVRWTPEGQLIPLLSPVLPPSNSLTASAWPA